MIVLKYKYKYVGLLKFSDEHIKEISFIRRKKLRNYVIQVSTEKKNNVYLWNIIYKCVGKSPF